MAAIELQSVSKRFVDGTQAVHALDLSVADGEFMVLVGPSGCGKSTVLRMVAGLEEATAGEVWIGGHPATDRSPAERDIAMVFQDYALYPHMTVYRNIAFALKPQKLRRAEVDQRVRAAAALLGIDPLLSRKPGALSGGERQRVAMGRAIVRQPAAFLMDEPLSNLDAKLRVEMRSEMRRLHAELGTTFVFVTHDQIEAMTMGDRVAVMRRGRLQQVDRPQRLYERPANVFVAGFIGSPPMNLVEATLVADEGGTAAVVGPWRVPLPGRAGDAGRSIILGIRPEHFDDPADRHDVDERTVVEVTVDSVEPLGGVALVHFHLAGAKPVTVPELVDRAGADRRTDGAAAMIASVDGRRLPAAGDRQRLAIDSARVHAFDRATGAALRRSGPSAAADALPR